MNAVPLSIRMLNSRHSGAMGAISIPQTPTTPSPNKQSAPTLVRGFSEEGTFKDREIEAVLKILPNSHINGLACIECDFMLHSLTRDKSVSEPPIPPMGRYYPDRKHIYIYDCSSRWIILCTLLHEIGHHYYQWHLEEVLINFWIEKGYPLSKPVSKYGATNAEEGFAEAYMYYVLEPFISRKESIQSTPFMLYYMARAVFKDRLLDFNLIKEALEQ